MIDWTGWSKRMKEKRRWKGFEKREGNDGGKKKKKSRKSVEKTERRKKITARRSLVSGIHTFQLLGEMKWATSPSFQVFFSPLPVISPTLSHLPASSQDLPQQTPPAPITRLTSYYFIPTFSPFRLSLSLSPLQTLSQSCKLGCLSSLISKQASYPSALTPFANSNPRSAWSRVRSLARPPAPSLAHSLCVSGIKAAVHISELNGIIRRSLLSPFLRSPFGGHTCSL